MRIRAGYVSNSSSSSFILMASASIAGLTSDDWKEMLKDLYRNYESRVKEHEKFLRENDFDDDGYFPFCVFDLNTERDEATKTLLDVLEGWKSSHSVIHNGVLEASKTDVLFEWRDYCESIENEIEDELSDKYDYIHVNINPSDRDSIRNSKYSCSIDAWNKKKHYKIQVREKYLKALENKWDELGICDNADVMKNAKSRFVVHFDENEYCFIDGIDDEGAGWNTEAYSYGRLCEIFARWLVEHKKVPSDFDWHELVDDTLTVNMHEG